ncbi:MAG TPA: hypothetical protein ENK19_03395 [Acidobacteria bacterium]|nr:hypothetical protein [Acidobacteriota bacterium]
MILTLCGALPLGAQEGSPLLRVDVRRVRISLGFAGQQIFIFGQVPEGTTRVVSVMEAPPGRPVRLMRKGKVGPFWFGVRQYAVAGLPTLYLVNMSCPGGNVLKPCPVPDLLSQVNHVLEKEGVAVGPKTIVRMAKVKVLKGSDSQEAMDQLFEGFWKLEASRGLYGVDDNGIHLTKDGKYFYRAIIPAHAPEAKYTITTYFLDSDRLIDAARVELFVSRSGLVAWLARLAERQAYLYGAITVFIALAAGLFVGTIFRRHGGH